MGFELREVYSPGYDVPSTCQYCQASSVSVPTARPNQKVQFALDDSLGYALSFDIHFFLSSAWGQCAQRPASPLNA